MQPNAISSKAPTALLGGIGKSVLEYHRGEHKVIAYYVQIQKEIKWLYSCRHGSSTKIGRALEGYNRGHGAMFSKDRVQIPKLKRLCYENSA